MSGRTLTQKEQKELVGKSIIDYLIDTNTLTSGMKVGLGTGSTAMPAVKRLAERIADGTLHSIKAVPTSFQTSLACEDFGIPLFSLNSKEIGGELDIAIDGADEIDPKNNVIKGGGAAHVREKIVEYSASVFVVIADESKLVQSLGHSFPLPVEIIGEARVSVMKQIEKKGASCILREGVKKAGPVVTDNGNLILDVLWPAGVSVDPVKMEDELNMIAGVVENGFFTKKRPLVMTAHADGSIKVRE